MDQDLVPRWLPGLRPLVLHVEHVEGPPQPPVPEEALVREVVHVLANLVALEAVTALEELGFRVEQVRAPVHEQFLLVVQPEEADVERGELGRRVVGPPLSSAATVSATRPRRSQGRNHLRGGMEVG